jgi:hypothetical protein
MGNVDVPKPLMCESQRDRSTGSQRYAIIRIDAITFPSQWHMLQILHFKMRRQLEHAIINDACEDCGIIIRPLYANIRTLKNYPVTCCGYKAARNNIVDHAWHEQSFLKNNFSLWATLQNSSALSKNRMLFIATHAHELDIRLGAKISQILPIDNDMMSAACIEQDGGTSRRGSTGMCSRRNTFTYKGSSWATWRCRGSVFSLQLAMLFIILSLPAVSLSVSKFVTVIAFAAELLAATRR